MTLFKDNPVEIMLRKAISLDEGQLFLSVMSGKVVQKFAVDLNTNQMKDEFMNSEGILLSEIGGEYSPSTVKVGRKHSATSVDLYDTGGFHESFKIINVTTKSFEIESNPITDDGTNLFDRWGEEIEGLTFESLDKLAIFLIPLYQKYVREQLGL
jgi:hypothetical protein